MNTQLVCDQRVDLIDEFDKMNEYLSEYTTEDSDKGKLDNKLQTILNTLSQKIKELKTSASQPFTIAIVGAQGVGKSTLINLLLDSNKVMPSSFLENEKIIVKIRKAPDESLKNKARIFSIPDDNSDEFIAGDILEKDEFYNIIDSAKSSHAQSYKIKDKPFIEFYLDCPELENIMIINTPGMNVVTNDFYPQVEKLFIEADMIIWVNSSNQMLDKFNSTLINTIYESNKKIVSVLTKIDDLYCNDKKVGIIAPIEQFMKEVENDILFVHKGKKCLFLLDGLRSQVAKGFYSNTFKEKDDDINEFERAIEIIYNYLKYGFGYSTEGSTVDKLKEMRLINMNLEVPEKPEGFPEVFNIDTFVSWLKKEDIIKEEDGKYKYTVSGLAILSELSNFEPVKRFTQDFLTQYSDYSEKLQEVMSRTENLLSEDNVLKELNSLLSSYNYAKEELEEENRINCENIESCKKKLDIEHKKIKENLIKINIDLLTMKLLRQIIDQVGKQFNSTDFITEFVYKVPVAGKLFNKNIQLKTK
ncbi:MAG: dynamin family protein [Candidatus Cloacimonetes bacterium]|nr:dynamin family protein [Candidatus Cloacimonadota bacterium]